MSGTTGISASTVNQAVSIMTAAGGRVTGTSAEGIKTSTAGGPTVINVGGTVSAASTGIRATSASGAITVQGEGAINGAAGIVASSSTGAITISGTGATTGTAGLAIDAQITSAAATADLLINRSGSMSNASRGIYATNSGSGKVTVQGVGAVTAMAGDGIQTSATSGATFIDLTNNVRSASTASDISAVSATAAGTGNITVKTAARVTITANGGSSVRASGIYATAQGGNIDIGGAAGLGGAIFAAGRQIPAGRHLCCPHRARETSTSRRPAAPACPPPPEWFDGILRRTGENQWLGRGDDRSGRECQRVRD